jgi:putative flippase GtrA
MTTQASANRLIARAAQKDWRPFGIDIGRLSRAALTGGVCGALQLALLDLLIATHRDPAAANTLAFLASAQLNFAMSARFIWGDRRSETGGLRRLAGQWVAFHGSVLAAAGVNFLAFQAARTIMAPLPAAALGIASTALLNFAVQDRLVFSQGARS